jgi:hypothetical protein
MTVRPTSLFAVAALCVALFVAGFALAAAPAAKAAGARPDVVVHHNPGCGCCLKWVAHLRASGYPVEVVESADLDAERRRLGVPVGKASCHTAEVGGYFVEGHVPVADIDRLLARKPKARGLTAPGMPMGSPGMETPDGRVSPYDVLLVGSDGATSVWARHGE